MRIILILILLIIVPFQASAIGSTAAAWSVIHNDDSTRRGIVHSISGDKEPPFDVIIGTKTYIGIGCFLVGPDPKTGILEIRNIVNMNIKPISNNKSIYCYNEVTHE